MFKVFIIDLINFLSLNENKQLQMQFIVILEKLICFLLKIIKFKIIFIMIITKRY